MENAKERAAAANKILADFQKKANLFESHDVYDIQDLVTDLLQLDIDYTKKHEPYATNSINRMEVAIGAVRNLHLIFEED